MDGSEFHDLSELALNSDGQSWGNLGYWDEAENNYSNACRALALQLGEAAQLNENSTIFDAGFGCGDQLCLWLDHFQVRNICGVNLSNSQTQWAKSLLAKKGHDDKSASIITASIDKQGAWHRAIGDYSISHVLALDCAYHFPSRIGFFNLAQKQLEAGGRIAVTDFILSDHQNLNFAKKFLLSAMLNLSRIPRSNIVDRSLYLKQLDNNGFQNVKFHDVSQPVMAGFSGWIRSRESEYLPFLSRLKYRITAAFLNWAYRQSVLQYFLITAEKQDHKP